MDMDAVVRKTKARLLRMHYESGVGHIGGNLSALDMILTLHHRVMGADDVFILSKGHAAGALYATLWSLDKLRDEDLDLFHRDGTKLSGHPAPKSFPEIPFATGSLGHGLSLACGVALGKRLTGRPGRVFCLLSDGEWNEGSTWEGLTFAAHHRLENLTLLIDVNGLQGFGATREVADLSPLEEKLRAFGVPTDVVDGHDVRALAVALARTPGPRAIAARTIKGRGVSFMENRLEWHYRAMDAEQYRRALAEIGAPDGRDAA